MLRILVSNDDGIEALGIRTLVRALSKMPDTEVYVFAPEAQRSASGQAITMAGKIMVTETEFEGAVRAFYISGSPADCVKFGIDKLRSEGINPDFVIGGINHGGNAGLDINYSGTFAIANEGAINGCHAIALSVADRHATHFEYICDMLKELIELAGTLPIGTILNVNTPNTPKWEIKGTMFAGSGLRGFADNFVSTDAPDIETDSFRNINASAAKVGKIADADSPEGKGENFENASTPDGEAGSWYKYSGEVLRYMEEGDSDLHYLSRGYATVTPFRVDRVNHSILAKLRGITTHKTLCMFIDVQEKEISEMRKSEKFMNNILKLAKSVGLLELPALLTEQFGHDSSPVSRKLKSNLDNFEKIDKVDFDCTKTRDFENLLMTHEGKRIALAGLETHISLLQTAKSLIAKGYEVLVIKDCCASRNNDDHETALSTLAQLGAEVTTLESFIYEELGSATDFAYREIKHILTKEDEEKERA